MHRLFKLKRPASALAENKFAYINSFNKACALVEQCYETMLFPKTRNKSYELVNHLKAIDSSSFSSEERSQFEALCIDKAESLLMFKQGVVASLEILACALSISPDSERIKNCIRGIDSEYYENEDIQKRIDEIFSLASKVKRNTSNL